MFLLQLPADFSKLHPSDSCHSHMTSSQSRSSIASDSGSSSLSDIYQVIKTESLSLYKAISLHTLQQKRILTDLLWTSGTHSHAFKSCRGLPHPPLWSICHLSITYSCQSSSTHSFWSTDQHFTRTHKHPSHVQTQSLRVPTHTSVLTHHLYTRSHIHMIHLSVCKCRSQSTESR